MSSGWMCFCCSQLVRFIMLISIPFFRLTLLNSDGRLCVQPHSQKRTKQLRLFVSDTEFNSPTLPFMHFAHETNNIDLILVAQSCRWLLHSGNKTVRWPWCGPSTSAVESPEWQKRWQKMHSKKWPVRWEKSHHRYHRLVKLVDFCSALVNALRPVYFLNVDYAYERVWPHYLLMALYISKYVYISFATANGTCSHMQNSRDAGMGRGAAAAKLWENRNRSRTCDTTVEFYSFNRIFYKRILRR